MFELREDTRFAEQGCYFPTNVFGEEIERLFIDLVVKRGYPPDYLAGSMIAAVSAAIGNSMVLEVMEGWHERAVVYVALVGSAGSNKSHPMSFAMQPLLDRDLANIAAQIDPDDVVKRTIVSDTTPEGLVALHALNKRGLILFADELKSWIANFTRYNAGSQEQFWLSNFSSKPIVVDRKAKGTSVAVAPPFISVLGSTQTKILKSFARGDRSSNGFIDRMLFFINEKSTKPYWSSESIEPGLLDIWTRAIEQIADFSYAKVFEQSADQTTPLVLHFSDAAREMMYEWQMYNADMVNEEEDEMVAGAFTKLEVYCTRFAMICHTLMFYSTDLIEDITTIDALSMANAIELAEYVRLNTLKAHTLINDNGEEEISVRADILHKALPEQFDSLTLIETARSKGMHKATAYRLLNRYMSVLWDRVDKGQYIRIDS